MDRIPMNLGFGWCKDPLLAFAGYTITIGRPPRKNSFAPPTLVAQLVSSRVTLAASPFATARPAVLAGLLATI